MQVKLSYLEPTFRVITTTATMGPDDAEPTKHTETAVLGNIFTYLAIPNVDDTSLLSSIGSLDNDSDNDSTDWSENSDDVTTLLITNMVMKDRMPRMSSTCCYSK